MPLQINGYKLPLVTGIAAIGQLVMLVWFLAEAHSQIIANDERIEKLQSNVNRLKSETRSIHTQVEILKDRADRNEKILQEQSNGDSM